MITHAWWLLPLIWGALLTLAALVDQHWPPYQGRHEVHGGDR